MADHRDLALKWQVNLENAWQQTSKAQILEKTARRLAQCQLKAINKVLRPPCKSGAEERSRWLFQTSHALRLCMGIEMPTWWVGFTVDAFAE